MLDDGYGHYCRSLVVLRLAEMSAKDATTSADNCFAEHVTRQSGVSGISIAALAGSALNNGDYR